MYGSTLDGTQLLLSITVCSFQQIIITLHMHAITLFLLFCERRDLVYHFGEIIHSHRHRRRFGACTAQNDHFYMDFPCNVRRFSLAHNILSMQTHEQETTNRNNGNSMLNHTLPCEWNEMK